MNSNGLPPVLRHETVWMDANKYQDAERQYHEHLALGKSPEKQFSNSSEQLKSTAGKPISSIALEIANAREKITNLLSGDSITELKSSQVLGRLQKLEEENKAMNKKLSEMSLKIVALEKILSGIDLSKSGFKDSRQENMKQNGPVEDEEDDDVDLFGSDNEEDEDVARMKEERLKAYQEKKSKKPALVAKSSVVLDVKPWDDETDMKDLESAVRKISSDGLKWGASKLVPLAYGIKKLQIIAIVEDDKVSIDWLQEAIQENEDLVQSVDIAAFNKL